MASPRHAVLVLGSHRSSTESFEHMCDRWAVGTNRRYPDAGARRQRQQRLEDASRRGALQTLTDEQLQLAARVVSIAPERGPIWASAWLRFGDTDIRCTVLVKRWTADAVGVELQVGEDKLRCWVWQGAVERAEGPVPPP